MLRIYLGLIRKINDCDQCKPLFFFQSHNFNNQTTQSSVIKAMGRYSPGVIMSGHSILLFDAKISQNISFKPLRAIIFPITPMNDIKRWKPPSLTVTLLNTGMEATTSQSLLAFNWYFWFLLNCYVLRLNLLYLKKNNIHRNSKITKIPNW